MNKVHKREPFLSKLLVAVILVCFTTFAMAHATGNESSARIWTDKADYAPGETVTIFGSSFLHNAKITLTVTWPNSQVDSWSSVASDSAGNFAATYHLLGMDGTFTVTATDGTNTATTTFTDTVSIDNVVPSDSSGNMKISFLTTDDVYCHIATHGGGPGPTVRIYVVTSIPPNGSTLTDGSEGYETISLLGDTTTKIWSNLTTQGTYCVVLDENQNGKYDTGEHYSSSFAIGGPIPITFQTSVMSDTGSATVLTVDGASYTYAQLPQTFIWIVGSTHSINASTPVSAGTDTRYRWSSWINGNGLSGASGIYTVPSSAQTVTANYTIQYSLTNTLITNSVSSITPSQTADSWYDGGTEVNVVLKYVWNLVASQSRENLISYSVDGTSTNVPRAGIGTFNVPSITMSTYHSVSDESVTQYYLTVTSAYGTPSGSGWYDSGTTAYAMLSSGNVPGGVGTQYVFTGWSGDASGTGLTSDAITMNAPNTATANWQTQYFMTFGQFGVDSDLTGDVMAVDGVNYARTGYAGWYDSGANITFSYSSPLVVTPNVKRYVLTGVNASSPYTVSGSATVAGTYQTEYQVSFVVSPVGGGTTTPSGTNVWKPAGTLLISATPESGYAFTSWSATGSVIVTNSSSSSTTATISGPSTITANFAASSIDITAPVTTETFPLGLDNWYTYDVIVPLAATDNESGVAQTYYRINNSPVKAVSVEGQPIVNTEGANNTLEYWSTDNAGNEENHHYLAGIKLDKTSPEGSITIDDGDIYTDYAYVALDLTATDSVSGVYQMRFSNDLTWTTWESYNVSRTWILTSGDGTKSVYFQVRDYAGIFSNIFTSTILLDTTNPSITTILRSPEGDIQPNQPVMISVNVTDTGSGIEDVRLTYFPNGSTIKPEFSMTFNQTSGYYERAIPGQQAGSLMQYQITVYDNAGNRVRDDNAGQYYIYAVVPEFSSFLIQTLLMIATLLAVIVCRRKRST